MRECEKCVFFGCCRRPLKQIQPADTFCLAFEPKKAEINNDPEDEGIINDPEWEGIINEE